MTGGQVAPTTPPDVRTTTTPHGNAEPAFNVADLVKAAGGTFVARWTTYQVFNLVKSFKAALNHKGFSFVEIIGQCTTSYGKAVGKRNASDFLAEYKAKSVRLSKAKDMTEEELKDRIVVGTLRDTEEPEFCERLYAQADRVGAEALRKGGAR